MNAVDTVLSSAPRSVLISETNAPSNTAIHIRGLRKAYGTIEAVRGIDLDAQVGEIFGLIGPDGAGKTSVFQILGGVMQATECDDKTHGTSARYARSNVG